MGDDVLGSGNSQCKGPEAALCLTCLKNSEEAAVAGRKGVRARAVGVVVRGA